MRYGPEGIWEGPAQRALALAVSVVYGLPALAIVMASFKTDRDIVNSPAAVLFAPTLDAYRDVLDANLARALVSSALIAGGTTVLTMATAIPTAYVLARARTRYTALVVGVLIFLQMTPGTVLVIPLFPVLDSLNVLGGREGVILALSAVSLPFAILLMRPNFLGIPAEVSEAGQLDGAGPMTIFFRLMLPLARNGALVISVLLFMAVWGEFLFSITLLRDPALYPISALLAQQQSFYGTQWNSLMAIAVLGSIPTLTVYLLVARRLRAGIALGAVK